MLASIVCWPEPVVKPPRLHPSQPFLAAVVLMFRAIHNFSARARFLQFMIARCLLFPKPPTAPTDMNKSTHESRKTLTNALTTAVPLSYALLALFFCFLFFLLFYFISSQPSWRTPSWPSTRLVFAITTYSLRMLSFAVRGRGMRSGFP